MEQTFRSRPFCKQVFVLWIYAIWLLVWCVVIKSFYLYKKHYYTMLNQILEKKIVKNQSNTYNVFVPKFFSVRYSNMLSCIFWFVQKKLRRKVLKMNQECLLLLQPSGFECCFLFCFKIKVSNFKSGRPELLHLIYRQRIVPLSTDSVNYIIYGVSKISSQRFFDRLKSFANYSPNIQVPKI